MEGVSEEDIKGKEGKNSIYVYRNKYTQTWFNW